MKSLFSIHAGEFLFGNEIQKRFPKLRIWLPAKDTGIDFLITNEKNQKPLSFQVKYARDFNWDQKNLKLKNHVKSAVWYSFSRDKIAKSIADYWVLVNYNGFTKEADYIFIKPSILLANFSSLNRIKFPEKKTERIECYICVTNNSKCYETRELKKNQQDGIVSGQFDNTLRDFSKHLEKWDIITKHFRYKNA